MKNETDMTLAYDYRGQNVLGWVASEKLDGCRALWDGAQFWTRGGNVIAAPGWFTAGLPKDVAMDGEIFCGRGRFTEARLAVQHGKFTERCCFHVFDAPGVRGDYATRMRAAQAVTGSRACSLVDFEPVLAMNAVRRKLAAVLNGGGEGIMLRNPAADYEMGRTQNLLKLKRMDDL